MAVNPYSQYNNSKILTATKPELTLMLYEGAIKFGNIAIMAEQKKDIPKAAENIKKVRRIIEELYNTLDTKYPVAKDFERIYLYLLKRLTDANISKDPEDMEEIIGHIRSMRDTWKEVMKSCSKKAIV